MFSVLYLQRRCLSGNLEATHYFYLSSYSVLYINTFSRGSKTSVLLMWSEIDEISQSLKSMFHLWDTCACHILVPLQDFKYPKGKAHVSYVIPMPSTSFLFL